MNDIVRLELIAQSYDRFFRTRDIEHLKDVERILEYDGLEEVQQGVNKPNRLYINGLADFEE